MSNVTFVPLIYDDESNNTLEISVDALNVMLNYRQNYFSKPESGGILIGRTFKESNSMIVDFVTEPTKNDKQKRFAFFRSDNHQKQLTQIWKDSEGYINYIGEWHTHPENDPSPSNVDLNGWLEKLKSKDIESLFLYFIIVGIKTIGVWQGNKQNSAIKKMLIKNKE